MGLLGSMYVNISANISGLTAGTAAAKAQLAQVAGGGALVAGALVGLSAVAVGAGVQAVKMAGDFQQGMTTLVTGAGEAQKNIGMVSNGILDLAVQTATSTKQLTDGMYMIESAGYHGADGLNVLKVAAQGAKVGNADLGVVANALTTEMTDYHMSSSQAAEAMNGLTATVANGKTVLQLLGNSMGAVLPIASKLGIGFPQVAGAMATMTNEGIPAQRAAQNLANVLTALSAPSATAQKAMVSVGLSAQQVKDTLVNQGLPAALQLIETHIGEKFPASSTQYTTALKSIMGGLTGLKIDSATGGASLSTLESNISAVSNAMKTGGNAVTGWSLVQQNFNFKMDQAKEILETTAIKIGTALLPAAQQLTNAFGVLVGAGLNMVSFFQHNQVAMDVLKVAGITLAGVIGGTLVAAVVALTLVAWPLIAAFFGFAAPFILVGAAIAGLVAIIVILYQRFEPVRVVVNAIGQMFVHVWSILVQSFMPAWNQLVAAFHEALPALQLIGGILLGGLVVAIGITIAVVVALATGIAAAVGGIVQVFTGLVQIITGVFNIIGGLVMFFVDLFTGRFDRLGSDLGRIWQGITQIFRGAWNVIAGIFNAAAGLIGGIVVGFVNGIIGFFRGLWDALVGHSIIPDMVNGIINWFAQLPGRALAAVQGLLGMIGGFFSNLASQALQWGANIINNIAAGIRNAIGAVGDAISSVANFISSHLPHSPAKLGPLRDLLLQGSMIPEQISQGILSNMPKLETTMRQLPYPGSSSPAVLASVAAAHAASVSSGSQSGDIHIYIDGKDVTDALGPHIARAIRGKGARNK